MKFVWSFLLLLAAVGQATEGNASVVGDMIYSKLKKEGFEPGRPLQDVLGLKVVSCELHGQKIKIKSDDLGRCVFYAFMDFDKTEVVSPVAVLFESTRTKKKTSATLTWTPMGHRVPRQSWVNLSPMLYTFYRVTEIRLLIKYIVSFDLRIDFTEALSRDDLQLSKVPQNIVEGFVIDQIIFMTLLQGDEGTVAGQLNLNNKAQGVTLFKSIFKTDWNLKKKKGEPVKVNVKGRLGVAQ